MTNERIDAAIAELATVTPDVAKEVVTEQPEKAQDVAATEAKPAEVAEPKDGETPEADDREPDVAFPKKAVNAISRRDKQIGKLRAQNEAFQAQLAELQTAATKAMPAKQAVADPNQPTEEQFDNYGEYLKASIKYELAKDQPKDQAAPTQPNQATPEQIQQYQARVERVQAIAVQEAEFLKIAPDYHDVEAEYQDLIDQAPADLVNLFLEVENPPQAFYTLAKQGKLEALLDMPLHKAAIEIGKAAAMGVQPKKVSSAPTPIKSASGSGSGSKAIDAMNPNELRAWLKT